MTAMGTGGYTEERANHYLEVSEGDWKAVPWLEENWATMHEIEQLTYDLEWNITESRLHELSRWAEAGRLTLQQMERYHNLMRLVDQYRPVIERLRNAS